MTNLKFYKYHGAGNDFIIIDARDQGLTLSNEFVARMCHRRFGIGADGLMTLENDSAGAEFYMRYWNADGGESTMCGNGGRCISLFAHHLGIGGPTKHFNSSDGLHSVQILEADNQKGMVKLGMVDVETITRINDNSFFVFTGSPHYVEFTDNIMDVDVVNRGRVIRNSYRFAAIGGTNVNFVEVLSDGRIKVRTYERGVEDETLACGTGATAAAIVTAWVKQPHNNSFRIKVMGGELVVDFTKPTDKYTRIELSGPAEKVFEGFFL